MKEGFPHWDGHWMASTTVKPKQVVMGISEASARWYVPSWLSKNRIRAEMKYSAGLISCLWGVLTGQKLYQLHLCSSWVRRLKHSNFTTSCCLLVPQSASAPPHQFEDTELIVSSPPRLAFFESNVVRTIWSLHNGAFMCCCPASHQKRCQSYDQILCFICEWLCCLTCECMCRITICKTRTTHNLDVCNALDYK